MTMMQGDQYKLPITGAGFDLDDVEKIEFYIGGLIKTYPEDVTCDTTGEDPVFLLPVTQKETLLFSSEVQCQARVVFKSGDVIGASMGSIDVQRSLTRTVL